MRGIGRRVASVCEFGVDGPVCLSALKKGKRLELSIPNLVHIILYDSGSAKVNPEVKRSNVKVTRLRMAASECAAPAVCCSCCKRGMHTSLRFLVFIKICKRLNF